MADHERIAGFGRGQSVNPDDGRESLREELLGALRLALHKISAKLILASKDAKYSDWHLMGRSVGRVERDLRDIFSQTNDPERLRRMAATLLAPNALEAQVKSTYLFAKAHSLDRPSDEKIEKQLELLQRWDH